MKNSLRLGKPFWLIIFSVFFVGCSITITHKFDKPPVIVNNYYQGTNGGTPIEGDNWGVNNTLATEDLGVGYDITAADPEDWAKNSVAGVGVRPRIFDFQPNPDINRTIDIPQLDGPVLRRNLPLGVNAETNPKFDWEEKVTFVYNSEDFQNSHGGSFSAGGGAMGVAFSASTSFQNAQEKTTTEETSLGYKNGAFRGHTMEIDFSVAQNLTQKFRDAVKNLDANNSSKYRPFIINWGTHFTKTATIGAKCAYRMEFNNEELSTRQEDQFEFEAEVSGGMAGVEVEVGGGYNESSVEAAKEATKAENIVFVSFGGSGAGIDDFPKWTEHAIKNPTLIDVYLLSYDTLFTTENFPDDPYIGKKKVLFKEALKSYYDWRKQENNILPLPKEPEFQKDSEYTMEFQRIFYEKGEEDNEEFWGKYSLKLFDEYETSQDVMKEFNVYATKESPTKMSPDKEFNIREFINLTIKAQYPNYTSSQIDKTVEQIIKKDYSRTFTISALQKKTFFISMVGQMKFEWWGENSLTQLHPRRNGKNSITLDKIKVGQRVEKDVKVTHTHKPNNEVFNLIFTYSVTRNR